MTPLRSTTPAQSYLLDHNYSVCTRSQPYVDDASEYQPTSDADSENEQTTTKPSKRSQKRKHTQTNKKSYREYFAETSIPIRTTHTKFHIQTAEEREALLAIHHKPITVEQRAEHVTKLKNLDQSQLKNLTYKKRNRSDYSSYRIIYIHTEKQAYKPPSSIAIWKDIYTSQKGKIKANVAQCKACKDVATYKQKLSALLNGKYLKLFKKIESFSISHSEYLLLREHVNVITHDLDTYLNGLFFPGIVGVNRKTKGQRLSFVHPSYILAAKAHLQIKQQSDGSSHVLTDSQKRLVYKLSTRGCSSLKKLENTAAILQPLMTRRALLRLIHKAVHHMEKDGRLPLPPQDVNDPYLLEQFEARQTSKPKKRKSTKLELTESHTHAIQQPLPTKSKRSRKHKAAIDQGQTSSTITQIDWTEMEPSTSSTSIEALEQSAALTLISLQYSKDIGTDE